MTDEAHCDPFSEKFPVTFSEDKFPTLVMLGWAAVWSVPSRKVPDSLVPLTLPAVTFPVTLREDNVPTLVKLDVVMPDPSVLPLRTETPLMR
jgi:hypothetical protein